MANFGRPAGTGPGTATGFFVASGLESGFTVSVPANYGTEGNRARYGWWRLRTNPEWSTLPHRLTSNEVAADQKSDIRSRRRIFTTQTRQNPAPTNGVSFTPATTTTLPTPLFKAA